VANSSWAQEISIDVDTVSAVCPNCNIVLVEATTASLTDLGAAVNTAVSMRANVVSNSGVALSWWAPVSNGGSAVTSYRVYRSLSPGTETLVACTTASCGLTDTATHRATYYYQVAAVTAKVVGPLSDQASVPAQ
jgi:hypothetical protein